MITKRFIFLFIGLTWTFLQGGSQNGTGFIGLVHAQQSNPFRFHIIEEPARLRASLGERFSGQYLLGNLFLGLYRINGQGELIPALAKTCLWRSEVTLDCEIPKRSWSGGKTFTAADIEAHIKVLLDPKNVGEAAEIFMNVKGVSDFLKSEKPWSKVGISLGKDKNNLVFTLNSPDRDFLFRLTHPALSPVPVEGIDEVLARDFATGPYRLKEWRRGRSLRLEENPHALDDLKGRPEVEIYFIAEDTTALNLFEKDKLDLLRRMPPESQRRFMGGPVFACSHFCVLITSGLVPI